MCGRFDGPDFSLRTARHDGESSFHGSPLKVGIDFEVAEELFGDDLFIFAVERLQILAGPQANLRHRAGKFGSIAFAIGNGARYGVDDDVLRSRVVLGALGVLDIEHVAGKLDECILKSAARADERPVPPPGKLDSLQHPIETLIGTSRRGPQAIKSFKNFFRFRGCERRRWHPRRFDCHFQFSGSVLKRVIRRMVRAEVGIKVPENSDANSVTHASIVLEQY